MSDFRSGHVSTSRENECGDSRCHESLALVSAIPDACVLREHNPAFAARSLKPYGVQCVLLENLIVSFYRFAAVTERLRNDLATEGAVHEKDKRRIRRRGRVHNELPLRFA